MARMYQKIWETKPSYGLGKSWGELKPNSLLEVPLRVQIPKRFANFTNVTQVFPHYSLCTSSFGTGEYEIITNLSSGESNLLRRGICNPNCVESQKHWSHSPIRDVFIKREKEDFVDIPVKLCGNSHVESSRTKNGGGIFISFSKEIMINKSMKIYIIRDYKPCSESVSRNPFIGFVITRTLSYQCLMPYYL